MAKNPSRLISIGSWLARRICTVAQAVKEEGPPAASSQGEPRRIYRRLSALGATRGSIAKTLNDYMMEGRAIEKSELIRCIQELRKYRRFDHGLEIMEWMKKREMIFRYSDHAMYLDLIAKVRGIAAAENYFNGLSLPSKNRLTYGALLNSYCKELLSDKALALFEQMDKMNFLPFHLPFNYLMTLHMRLGQPEKVPILVHEMKRRNISFCTYTYNMWMQSCGCLNDFEGVERVLDEMKTDGVNCDWSTYSNLATIYVKAGLFEKAESALRKLEVCIGTRYREAYHYLISLYAGISNLREVNRIWISLKSSFPTTTNLSYLVMLQALAKLKNVEGITRCFKEWESNCSSYDVRLANVAIRAYLEQDMYEEAESIFEDALKRCKGPIFKAREMFMVFFLKANQLDLALEHIKAAFSEVKDHDWQWQPNQETVDAFLNYFVEERDVDGSEKFCKILKHINCLDVHAYSLLLKTYMAAGRLAPEMRQKLEEDNIEITDEIENLLVRVSPK